MTFQDPQQRLITPLPETAFFEKTLFPKSQPIRWERQIVTVDPKTSAQSLSFKAQQILEQSRHVQAQLQQLTQGFNP
jgi:hypothetical protein